MFFKYLISTYEANVTELTRHRKKTKIIYHNY